MKPSNLAGLLVSSVLVLPAISLAQNSSLRSRIQEPPAPTQTIPVKADTTPHLDPASPAGLELRGDILMARKQFSEAIDVYEEVLKSNPRNAFILNRVGIAYHQLQDLTLARKYYERAHRADRNFPYAVNNLGSLEYDRKKFRNAVNWYRRAITLSPGTATFHSNLGHAYFQQKKYDEAFLSIRRALEIDPTIYETRSTFGSILQQRQITDRGAYLFFVAKTFASLGDADKCARYLLKARDEGYKGISSVRSDPAFATVISHPRVVEVLDIIAPLTTSVGSARP